MEIQAAILLGTQPAGCRRLEVWSLLTEHGDFWLVEEGGAVELFRRAPGGVKFAGAAVRQFLKLHPAGRTVAPPPPGQYDCRGCGVRVAPRRRGTMADRQCCRRCYHAERERERYRRDPEYRAHLLVTRRASYRAARGRGNP